MERFFKDCLDEGEKWEPDIYAAVPCGTRVRAPSLEEGVLIGYDDWRGWVVRWDDGSVSSLDVQKLQPINSELDSENRKVGSWV